MKRFLFIFFIFLTSLAASNMSQERLIPIYLYDFSKYTNWPENFDKKVFEIYLVSSNKKLYFNMKKIIKKQSIHGKPIQVKIGSASNIPFTSDLIFVDKAYLKEYKKIYENNEGRPVLLVSNAYDNKRLVMINLKKTKDETLGFEVNKENIINQGLSINPQLILFGGTELDVAKLYKEAKDSLLQKEKELQKQLKKAQLLSTEIRSSKSTNLVLEKSIFEKNTKLEETEMKISSLSSDMKSLQDSILIMDEKSKKAEEQFALLLKKQKDIFKVAKQKLLGQEKEVKEKEKELNALSHKVQQKAVEFKILQDDLASAGVQIKDKDQIIDVQHDYLVFFELATAVFLILVLIILRVLREKHETNKKLSVIQAELEEQVKKTQKADASKTKFLAHMSHELRTPLNAVLGYSQILQKDQSLSKKHQKTLSTINNSGEHLLSLINDVLEVSKIETGHVELDLIAFDLYVFLDDIVNMFGPRIKEEGLDFDLLKENNLPQFIYADIGKIRQIFINLLGNAVKFTSVGGIMLNVSHKKNELIVQIQDSGVGIEEEEIDSLFKPFEQTLSGKLGGGGAGLGLSIVLEYIELMHGSIKVKSEPGVGTSFYLNIPFKPSNISELDVIEYKEVLSLKEKNMDCELLIADDNEVNLSLLEEVLTRVGYKVHTASNGLEALTLFKENRYEAVLLDINMPEMDGYEVLKEIKSLDDGREIPVLAVTASIFGINSKTVLDKGFDALVLKPFKDYELYETLSKLLGLEYNYEESAKEDEAKNISLKKIDQDLKNLLLEEVKKMKIASVKDILCKIELKSPSEAKYMQDLADDFKYEELQTLIEES